MAAGDARRGGFDSNSSSSNALKKKTLTRVRCAAIRSSVGPLELNVSAACLPAAVLLQPLDLAIVNGGGVGGGVQVSEEGFSEYCEIVTPSYDRSWPKPGSGDVTATAQKIHGRRGSTEIVRGRTAF